MALLFTLIFLQAAVQATVQASVEAAVQSTVPASAQITVQSTVQATVQSAVQSTVHAQPVETSVRNSVQQSQALIDKWIKAENEYLKKDRSKNKIERRIKILTTGRSDIESEFLIDSPDPSVVHRVRYPNNTWGYRISFTGMFYIEAPSPKIFYQGGDFKILKSAGQYPDGTKMDFSYDGYASPWDTIIYQNTTGENIAFGGMMEQQTGGVLPELDFNWTRSRWWGTVQHIKNANGHYDETIHWQRSLTRPADELNEFNWLGHSYGGTLLSHFDAKSQMLLPLLSAENNFTFFYETVTSDLHSMPWETSIVAKQLHGSLKKTLGETKLSVSPQKSDSSDFFETHHQNDDQAYYHAASRGENAQNGYLVEGPQVMVHEPTGVLLQTFSAGDFTGRYGMYLAFLPYAFDPLSRFEPAVDKYNELVDFAESLHLRDILQATWMGRPALDVDPDQNLWLRFHFVPVDILPPGAPIEGHPPYEYLGSYPRYAAQIPVKIVFDKQNRPAIEWDLDPEFAHQKEEY